MSYYADNHVEQMKVALYRLLLQKSPDVVTENEATLMVVLANEPVVQKRLEENKDSKWTTA